MQSYGTATLVYIGHGRGLNGSPIELRYEKEKVKVKIIRNFTKNFYVATEVKQRFMRYSKNFVVPIETTKDRYINNQRYELSGVIYKGIEYKIEEILTYYKSAIHVILDCEEKR